MKYLPANLIETFLPEKEAVTFDVAAFDDQIAANGIELVHFRSLPCPIGLIDRFDSRKPDHAQHASCSNGFIYKEAGLVNAFVSNAGNRTGNEAIGRLPQAYAVGTFSRKYNNNEQQFFARKNDRFYMADKNIVVPVEQTVQSSPEGFDKLDFPAEAVEYLVDSFGNEHKNDFTLVGGAIQWKTPLPFDPKLGVGAVYSVRYLYRPFWYCTDLMHELRFANQFSSGEKATVSMPQQLQLVREQVFLSIYKSAKTDEEFLSKEQRARLVGKPKLGIFGGQT